jgi:DNA processing protein
LADRGLTDLIIGRIPGLSPADKLVLCKRFDREAELALMSMGDLEAITGRKFRRRWAMDAVRAQAERDAQAARRRGICYVSYAEAAYPPLLRESFDPPALLFYRGRLPDPLRPLAAVVGTRKPSAPAAAAAYRIGRELGEGGVPVVSGLALGIDALAHRGNLDGGAPAAAVLGAGLDGVYPAANRSLAARILEQGGAILGEYPPGTTPRKGYFPARNRIISALSRGVLVVEAPEKSGALITARHALDQNRDLWVSSAGLKAAGTRRLVEDGARAVSSGAEIFEEWGIAPREKTGRPPPGNLPGGARLASSLARELDIQL